MTEAQRTWQASDHRGVAGRYELVGLNGSLLPVEVEDEVEEGSSLRAFLVEGEEMDTFGEAVGLLREDLGERVTLTYVGPLPPYTFAETDLSAGTAAWA